MTTLCTSSVGVLAKKSQRATSAQPPSPTEHARHNRLHLLGWLTGFVLLCTEPGGLSIAAEGCRTAGSAWMSSQAGAALATSRWHRCVPGQTVWADCWGPQSLSQHLSDSIEASLWGSALELECPTSTLPGCTRLPIQGCVCEEHAYEGHTYACTWRGQVTLEGAFPFSTTQVGIEAKPKR